MDPKIHAMKQREATEATAQGVQRIEAKLDLLLSGLEVAVPAAKPTEPEAQPEAPAADDDHATGKHRRHAR